MIEIGGWSEEFGVYWRELNGCIMKMVSYNIRGLGRGEGEVERCEEESCRGRDTNVMYSRNKKGRYCTRGVLCDMGQQGGKMG